MDTQEKHQLQETIEDIIDKSSLHDVLDMLSDICYDKAEHLISNWQDKVSARVWEKAANAIDRLSSKIDI